MTTADAVYELVVHEVAIATSWVRRVFSFLDPRDIEPSGVIISVVHRETGDELFRHIEDDGDDEDHMLADLQRDLASLSSDEFAARWG